MKLNVPIKSTLVSLATVFMLTGCDSSTDNEASMEPFELNFKAMSSTEAVSCDTTSTGFGTDGEYSIGLKDLRFYVSNVTFYDEYGVAIESTFDDSDFQLNHEEGFVGLIDLTSNTSGSCDGVDGSTERTNTMLTGMVLDTGVRKVTFDIGVPQAVMKDVINTSSAEDAPSPLNEMYWSWASGYRHFLMNFTIENTSALTGGGALHIGSKGCGSTDGLLALEDKDTCDFVNTPQVELTDFDLVNDSVVIDLDALLTDVAFSSTDAETGTEKLSVNCHSNTAGQADCTPIFNNFGIDTDDGTATASDNSVVIF